MSLDRTWCWCVLAIVLCVLKVGAAYAQDSTPPPTRFDIAIDGEIFSIDASRTTELKSQRKPGVVYKVAIRPAEYQPWKLNTLAFDYHRGFKLADDHTARMRTATLQHNLGFTLAIGDLGAPQSEAERKSILDELVAAMRRSIEANGGTNIDVSDPKTNKFGTVSGLGVLFAYQLDGESQRSMVLVLTNQDVAATAVLHYAEKEQADVLPIVRPTLESIRMLAKR